MPFIITIPVHDIPSSCKSYPVLQSHTYEPSVLLHICSQSFNAASAHSLMSKKIPQLIYSVDDICDQLL